VSRSDRTVSEKRRADTLEHLSVLTAMALPKPRPYRLRRPLDEQWPLFAECEPRRRLAGLRVGVFAERCHWHEATVPCRKPAAPVRAHDIADVGDRLAAKLRRAGHAPGRHDQFALTIHAVAHDRRGLVWEDHGERREVAGPVVGGAEQRADGDPPVRRAAPPRSKRCLSPRPRLATPGSGSRWSWPKFTGFGLSSSPKSPI
jgi:hypothetical protein